MTFRLHVELGNEAMCEPEHVVTALRDLADKIERLDMLLTGWGPIRDGNGNEVGRFEVVK